MKRLFLIGAIALMTSCGSTQNTTAIKNLKEQQEVLDLTAKLNKTQLDYEKEKVDYNELAEKAANVNADANIATANFLFMAFASFNFLIVSFASFTVLEGLVAVKSVVAMLASALTLAAFSVNSL